MAKVRDAAEAERPRRKPVAWLHSQVKSPPPFTAEGRKEAGDLWRLLQAHPAAGQEDQDENAKAEGVGSGRVAVR
jgi:hypothetical protein